MADAKSALQQRLQKARADAVDDVPIAGAEDVVVRYGALPRDFIADLTERHQDDQTQFDVSIVINACQALLIRDDDGRLVSLDTDDPEGCYVDEDGNLHGNALTYSSERTHELLDVDGAKQAVFALHPREGAIDNESLRVIRLSGYGDQAGERRPERRRSTATR